MSRKRRCAVLDGHGDRRGSRGWPRAPSASVTLPSLEKRDGMSTPMTCSGPSASTAMAATSDESMPPDRPMTTSVKPFLTHVVARAEHERLVDLAHGREQRLDPGRARACSPRWASLTAHLGQRGRARAAARIEQPATERRTDVDVDDEEILGELRGAGDEMAALVEQHRRAVEDELVLPADEVHVEHRHRRVGGARREHRLALVDAAGVVGRRVDVDDQLGAAGGLRDDRTVRAPGVFADR